MSSSDRFDVFPMLKMHQGSTAPRTQILTIPGNLWATNSLLNGHRVHHRKQQRQTLPIRPQLPQPLPAVSNRSLFGTHSSKLVVMLSNSCGRVTAGRFGKPGQRYPSASTSLRQYRTCCSNQTDMAFEAHSIQ